MEANTDDVRRAQLALRALRLYRGFVDGLPGPRTAEALRAFQERSGLEPTGSLDGATARALAAVVVPSELGLGDTGPEVEVLQHRLVALGFLTGPPDGAYGGATEAAVRAAQRAAGLEVDGIAGERTRRFLYAPDPPSQSSEPAPAQEAQIAQQQPAPRKRAPRTKRQPAPPAGEPHDAKYPVPFRLDDDAGAVVALAERLVARSDRAGEALLAAALVWALDNAPGSVTGQWLSELAGAREQSERVVAGALLGSFGVKLPRPVPVDFLTITAIDRFALELNAAWDVFHRVAPPDSRLAPHHLVAAVLPRVREKTLGLPVEDAAAALRRAVAVRAPHERADGWDLLLGPLPARHVELEGGTTADFVDVTKPLTDRLGFEVYVEMLALLIAKPDTPMPVSIGLFGEWGSGKSFFMGLLQQKVEQLAKRPESPYLRDVVQIRFNAWHYSDANLWASLADEIFEQLAAPQGGSAVDDARREEIRKALAENVQRRKELDAQTAEAETRAAELRAKLDEARAREHVTAAEFARKVFGDPAVQERIRAAAKAAGVPDVRPVVEEFRRTRDDAVAVRRLLFGRRWRWDLLGIGALLAGLAVVTAVEPGWADSGAFVAVGGFLAGAARIAGGARQGLAEVRKAAEQADAVERGLRTDDPEATKALRAAEAQVQALRAQLNDVVARVGELGRELAELNPGHRLYRFLVERAASEDYRSRLGLVSTIRKDFEQLVELMQRWRDAPADERTGAKRPIDRIVLYIDDLDRCPPEQVVAVLQAVHLLLAMDLFVVVVGVDPRWLLRSLRHEYASVLRETEDGADDVGRATPQNYLEKIFNIPFALPPMSGDSFGKLLRGMVPARAVPESPAPAPESPAPALAGEEAAPEHVAVQERSEIAATFAAATPEPPQVEPLGEDEVTFLARLSPLVRTPRSAIRMFNLYRMLRSTQNLSDAATFLGEAGGQPEYQVLAQLLAVLTGEPKVLADLLYAEPAAPADGGLVHRARGSSWRAFVADLLPVPDGAVAGAAGGGWRNGVVGAVASADVDGWRRVHSCLHDVAAGLAQDDVTPYRKWAPRLARFSFELSPLLREAAVEREASAS